MGELINYNQSAFIRGRQIHENFKTVQLTCRWLHARHRPTVLLKIDLAKAFDSVAWPFLLEVLEHAGFPLRWRNWVAAMLRTASTKVMVNGRPSRRILHARGLRQGDPLSPTLFVLVMEVLNALIHALCRNGLSTAHPSTRTTSSSSSPQMGATSPTCAASWTCSRARPDSPRMSTSASSHLSGAHSRRLMMCSRHSLARSSRSR
jgi:hypothetical protein